MAVFVVFAVLFLLGIIPIGINAQYNESGVAASLIAGPVRLLVYPKDRQAVKPERSGKKKATTSTQQKGGSYKDFIPLVHLVLDLLVDLRHKIRVNNLQFKLILSGDDPCDLAVNYGRAWAALGNLMPQLERVFTIRKRDLEIECDFAGDRTTVLFSIDITITVARLLYLGFRHGFQILKEYMRVMNNRKGGANV